MEKHELRDWLDEVRNNLSETNNCLARIEERIAHFGERLAKAEGGLEDITSHVQSVRTVSKVFTMCLGVVSAAAAALKLFRAF